MKEELCKILWIKGNSFAIDFKGFGIEIKGNVDKNVNEYISIKYQGDEKDFSKFKILSDDDLKPKKKKRKPIEFGIEEQVGEN